MNFIVNKPIDYVKKIILDNWHHKLKLKNSDGYTITFRPSMWWTNSWNMGRSSIELVSNKRKNKTKIILYFSNNFTNFGQQDRSQEIFIWLKSLFDVNNEDF